MYICYTPGLYMYMCYTPGLYMYTCVPTLALRGRNNVGQQVNGISLRQSMICSFAMRYIHAMWDTNVN
jgi:hypothetical protein